MKMWQYIHTMEYYSAVKKNGIMRLTGKCMELEKIILSDAAQIQEDEHCMFSLI